MNLFEKILAVIGFKWALEEQIKSNENLIEIENVHNEFKKKWDKSQKIYQKRLAKLTKDYNQSTKNLETFEKNHPETCLPDDKQPQSVQEFRKEMRLKIQKHREQSDLEFNDSNN
jgi:hypothetical protein